MATAFVFPGQGSQTPGMGRELATAFAPAREVFEEVDEALSQRLSRLTFEGPAETLMLTENAQPALMAVSLALVRTLEQEAGITVSGKASAVAGHSLGEYSALTAADSLTLSLAARLLRRRGQAMQEAVPEGAGAMAALIGISPEEAQALCRSASLGEVLAVANDNGAGQVVISGATPAIERALAEASAWGIRRTVKLPVSAPFHCSLMEPAAEAMKQALAEVAISAPAVPLVANVTAGLVSEPEEIRRLLVAQVTATVRWRESIEALARLGVFRFVELGTGKVLSGLVKRILPEATVLSAATPAEIETLVKAL